MGASSLLRRVLDGALPVGFGRPLVARVFGTLLCSIVITLRPASILGGRYMPLILTMRELAFRPGASLGTQIESGAMNFMGALYGIVHGNFGLFLATLAAKRYGPDSAVARMVPAVFLVLLAFLAGVVKSRLPRLVLASRLSCFTGVWLLTSNVGITQMTYHTFTQLTFVVATAGLITLLTSIVFLRGTVSPYAEQVVLALGTLRHVLKCSIDLAYDSKSTSHNAVAKGQSKLLKRSQDLDSAYYQAVFELRVGRVSVKSIKPFVGIVERARAELATLPERHILSPGSSEKEFFQRFQPSSVNLSNAMLSSLSLVQKTIVFTYEISGSDPAFDGTPEASQLQSEKKQLQHAVKDVRKELKKLLSELSMSQLTAPAHDEHRKQMSISCLFMISLLQMAGEVQQALDIGIRLLKLYECSKRRLWHPRFSLAWLGLPLRTVVADDDVDRQDHDDDDNDDDDHDDGKGLTSAETDQGLAEKNDQLFLLPTHNPKATCPPIRPWQFSRLGRAFWDHPTVLTIRVSISKIWRGTRHSKHTRHAAKNAIGVALLALPAYLPAGSAGRHWFELAHGQWTIISFLWVNETNTGASWNVGSWRLAGTLTGAVYGFITWVICRSNPYGTVAMVTVAEIPISWLILCSSIPALGSVAAVTLPAIVYIAYYDTSEKVIDLAAFRGSTIAMGILAALIINHMIFPRHCRVIFLRQAADVLSQITTLYLSLSRSTFQIGGPVSSQMRKQNLKFEADIRKSCLKLQALIDSMAHEMSLLPKPLRLYRKATENMIQMLDILTGLRRVRDNVPKKATLTDLLRTRRDLISCLCISTFACEQAFRSRHPLPQFLPSAHPLLHELFAEKEVNLGLEEHFHPHELSFSIIFAFAENEMYEKFVGSVENLLEVCRTLFGTASWMPDRMDAAFNSGAETPSSPSSGMRSPTFSPSHLHGFNTSCPSTPKTEYLGHLCTSAPPSPKVSRTLELSFA